MISAFALVCLLSAEPVDNGSRRELFVDAALIESTQNVELTLHEPVAREAALILDRPWEGNSCGYVTVFQDGDVYRMYYRGGAQTLKGEPPAHENTTCYAESADGVQWNRPILNLIEFGGSKENNLIWVGEASHNFAPFKDANPACPPEARYKAVALEKGGLRPFQSPDGIHWTRLQEAPIITQGAFDSQNLVFWDGERSEYRAYWRDFRDGRRDIKTATSKDFLTWSGPAWLSYPGAPDEQLYTNQILPYFRAPHIFFGFPTRYIDRGWSESMRALPGLEHRLKRSEESPREGTALTDGLFMSSRDGLEFHRWNRAFIRPGLRTADNWVYGDNYQAWGIIQTKSALVSAPDDLSIFATESYWTGSSCVLRRFTLRIDGFVSASAPSTGGTLVTKPLVFKGSKLALNFSTSAAGTIRIELQDPEGNPISGFALADAPEIFGDALDQVVPWKDNRTLTALSDKPVRLRFEIKDADLYAFRFLD